MNMLDIGVGGGRTTRYFAPLVKSYMGIDYSEGMVALCKSKFKHYKFQYADAKDLPFETNSFDFVLFSFNGIDGATHDDRLKILEEINRVTKPRGYFCFSTHNLNSLRWYISYHTSLNPKETANEIVRILRMRYYNRGQWRFLRSLPDLKFVCFKNGAHDFSYVNYFVSPLSQIDHLEKAGFSCIQIYGLADGGEIKLSELPSAQDFYLYYLCRK